MIGILLAKKLHHIAKILHMPTLIRTQRYALNILLNSTMYNLVNATVMPQMDHLRSATLQNTPHNINRRIMPIEQACCGNYPDLIFALI